MLNVLFTFVFYISTKLKQVMTQSDSDLSTWQWHSPLTGQTVSRHANIYLFAFLFMYFCIQTILDLCAILQPHLSK